MSEKIKAPDRSGSGEKYPCPCCGNSTYPVPREEALAYICPVCYWENDLFLSGDGEPSDQNHGLSLNAARENYRRTGAADKAFLRYVRPPLPEERPENNQSRKEMNQDGKAHQP